MPEKLTHLQCPHCFGGAQWRIDSSGRRQGTQICTTCRGKGALRVLTPEVEAEAARQRGLLDAVREGCRETHSEETILSRTFIVTLGCTREGYQALRAILRGEAGERDD